MVDRAGPALSKRRRQRLAVGLARAQIAGAEDHPSASLFIVCGRARSCLRRVRNLAGALAVQRARVCRRTTFAALEYPPAESHRIFLRDEARACAHAEGPFVA